MCCNERVALLLAGLGACVRFGRSFLGLLTPRGEGVGMRVHYLGSGGSRRGMGRGMGRGRKGRGVVVFELSQGCVRCFNAAEVVLDIVSSLCLWHGRVAGVGSLLAVLHGIRDCTRRTDGPHYSCGGRHHPSGNHSRRLRHSGCGSGMLRTRVEGIRMTLQVGRKQRLNFQHQYPPGNRRYVMIPLEPDLLHRHFIDRVHLLRRHLLHR